LLPLRCLAAVRAARCVLALQLHTHLSLTRAVPLPWTPQARAAGARSAGVVASSAVGASRVALPSSAAGRPANAAPAASHTLRSRASAHRETPPPRRPAATQEGLILGVGDAGAFDSHSVGGPSVKCFIGAPFMRLFRTPHSAALSVPRSLTHL
jgi:hypothetical protein